MLICLPQRQKVTAIGGCIAYVFLEGKAIGGFGRENE